MPNIAPLFPERETWSDLGIDIRGRTSGEVKTLCPKCSHNRKDRHKRELCLYANLDQELYNCHNCGWGGKLKGGETSPSRPMRHETVEKEYVRPLPIQKTIDKVDQWAKQVLRDRGISDEVIDDAGIMGVMEHMPGLERTVQTVAFPFFKHGEIINYKYLHPFIAEDGEPDKSCKQMRGAERIWYGLDWCNGAEQVIITEGEIDALSLRTVGYDAVLSVPDGAPATNTKEYSTKFSFFDGGSTIFNEAAIVIIATDTDGPGEVLANELARRIGKKKCFRADFPDDCKDANAVLMKYGEERLRRCITEANPWPVEGVISPKSLKRGVMLYQKGDAYQGVSTGFPSLDKIYRPALGQMTVFVGVPQHGKTTVMDTLAKNLSHLHGWMHAFFSPENYPPELFMSHMLQRIYKKVIADISEEEIDKALVWLSRHMQIIAPEHPTLSEILDRTQQLVQRDGTNTLIIDPWTEVIEEGENTQKFIKNGLTRLGRLKRDHDMHIFVGTHPRKLNEERDFDGQVKTPKPSGYDIADSAHFINKADNALTIWRDVNKPGSPIEVSVIKSRFSERGRRGTMYLDYYPVTMTLSDGGLADER